VYGLGADALSDVAVERLVAVRGREEGKPILVLVADVEMAGSVATSIPRPASRLAARFWPGPLTLVLPARPGLPRALTARTGTIGVRMPGSEVAAALVSAHGRPVTAPSANPPGAAPPQTIAAARAYFGDRVDVYVDGGTLPGGASTVAAIDGDEVRVLRAGPISESALRAALAGN
jgi:L-threonylcarbamoyladenylate synthase